MDLDQGWEAPDEAEVDETVTYLGRPDAAPAPERVDEQWIQFPPWFEGNYLVRMAPIAPSEIVEILLRVDDQANPWARRQIIDAATTVPVVLAERLVDRICGFVTSDRYEMLNPQALVRLVELMADAPTPRAVSLLRTIDPLGSGRSRLA
jgi:hypothetical protein